MQNPKLSPPDVSEFLVFMDAIGLLSPPALSGAQVVSLLATILRNYVDGEDEELLQKFADAAVATVVQCEAQIALDCAVGPEDGVH